MNDESTDDSDDDERAGLIAPILGAGGTASLDAPLRDAVSPAQHAATGHSPASGSPLQRPTGAESPATSPLQHQAASQSAGNQLGQRASGVESNTSLGQRDAAIEHTPDANAAAQHSGLQGPQSTTRFRRFVRRVAQRPRGIALIGISGAAVAAVVVAAIIVVAQRDSPQREVAAAAPTNVVDTSDAPVTAVPPRTTAVATTQAAPATTSAPTTTEAATTTTVAPTTTIPPSAAGSYTVTTSGFTVSAPDNGFSQDYPGASSPLTLAGACDGIGGCIANFGAGSFVNSDVTLFAPGTNAAFTNVGLNPVGASTYSASFTVPVDVDCGDPLVVTITMTVGAAGPTGAINFNSLGTGSSGCSTVTWDLTFTTVRS